MTSPPWTKCTANLASRIEEHSTRVGNIDRILDRIATEQLRMQPVTRDWLWSPVAFCTPR